MGPSWELPDGTVGDPSVIRVKSAAVKLDPAGCPLSLSIRLRPGVRPDAAGQPGKEVLQGFPLGPVMDALDQIEAGGAADNVIARFHAQHGMLGGRGRRCHPGLVEWAAGAVTRYVRARQTHLEDIQGPLADVAVRRKWVIPTSMTQPDHRGARHYEQTYWGRQYASADGEVRELWLLGFSTSERERDPADIALAANVAAFGTPCDDPPYGESIHVPARDLVAAAYAVPTVVRVVTFNCISGRAEVLCEWDPETARQRFEEAARPVLTGSIDGNERQPGRDCLGCPAISGCSHLPRRPGVVGLPTPATRTARRSLSATDLRAYRDCPAKYHLTRQLKLRGGEPEGEAVRRGRAVDQWLNEQHLFSPRSPHGCRDRARPPADGRTWTAGNYTLTGDEALAGAAMIAQHAAMCPLDGIDDDALVHVQPTLTFHDSTANVTLVATPDLLYQRGGRWIWRETKTAKNLSSPFRSFFEEWPQLAVATVMLGSGVVGDAARTGIELERLSPTTRSIEDIDPALPATFDEARRALSRMAEAWTDDVRFTTTPSPRACKTCEAKDFCVDAVG